MHVVLAQAGTQDFWIPASAGMTTLTAAGRWP